MNCIEVTEVLEIVMSQLLKEQALAVCGGKVKKGKSYVVEQMVNRRISQLDSKV